MKTFLKSILILLLFISLVFAENISNVPINKARYIKVDDSAGYFTGTEVETALQEIGAGTIESDPLWTADKPSYVPYTGATADLDLGMNSLVTPTVGWGGVNVLDVVSYSLANGGGGVKIDWSTIGQVKLVNEEQNMGALLDMTSLTGDKTFTFPDASGTLALTIPLSVTKSDNYSVLTTDTSKTLVMDTVAKTFSLPSVDATNVGLWFTFVKANAGSLIIDAADSDLINDSSAGGTIYDAQTNETYAVIIVQLVSATQWVAYGGVGTWTTN